VRSVASLIAPILFTQTFAASIGPLAGLGLPGAAFLLSGALLVTALFIVTSTVRAPAPQPA